MRKKIRPIVSLAAMIVGVAAFTLILAANASAEKTFASLKGKFWITYPDDWHKVDYNLVDQYLMANRAGGNVFDYQVVLSAGDDSPFFRGTYMIVDVDTVGQFSQKQIDSTLKALGSRYGSEVKYFPVADFLTELKTDEPSYDRDHQIVSVVSNISERQESLKKHLLMMEFYEYGIVYYYCYAPDSVFESAKTTFKNIATSLSTENLDAALERQTSAEMVSSGQVEGGTEVGKGDESGIGQTTYFVIGAILVLFVAIFIIKRKQTTQ